MRRLVRPTGVSLALVGGLTARLRAQRLKWLRLGRLGGLDDDRTLLDQLDVDRLGSAVIVSERCAVT